MNLVDVALAGAVDHAFELVNGSGPVPTAMTTSKADQLRWICERQVASLRRASVESSTTSLVPGKPLADLDPPYDELWWVRKKVKEENLSFLPPALQVRKKLDGAREQIDSARSEREVRRIVADINERIREVNRFAEQGPAPPVMPLDEEHIVSEWREHRRIQDR